MCVAAILFSRWFPRVRGLTGGEKTDSQGNTPITLETPTDFDKVFRRGFGNSAGGSMTHLIYADNCLINKLKSEPQQCRKRVLQT